MSQPPANPPSIPQRPGALDLVTGSFEAAWRRMTELLFTGPHASVANWFVWGLLIFLSGLVGGSGPSTSGRWDGEELPGISHGGWRHTHLPSEIDAGIWLLVGAGVCFAVVLALVWIYFQSRFRLVFLEGVLSGEPRIRGVFGRTGGKGLSYFVFEIALALGVIVLIVLPLLLIWLPLVFSLSGGGEPSGAGIAARVLFSIVWVVPIAIAVALADWFAYDLALPLLWRREIGMAGALRQAWALTRERLGAVVLFLLGRILVSIVVGVLAFIFFCLTCCVWILPAGLLAGAIFGLVTATIAFWPLALITVPAMLLMVFACAWVAATVFAPVYVFYRCWSVAFLEMLGPGLLSEPDDLSDPRPTGNESSGMAASPEPDPV